MASKIRILVDGRYLTSKMSGIGYFSKNILSELKCDGIEILSPYPVEKSLLNGYKNRFFFSSKIPLSGLIYDELILPFFILKSNHYLNVGGKLPLLSPLLLYFKKVKIITIIYDFTYKYNIDFFPNKIAYLIRKIGQSIAIRKSDHMISISNGTAIDLLRFYNKESEVVYPGFSFNESKNGVLGERKKGSYLFVGTVEPRKNLHAILDHFRDDQTLTLNLVGGSGWKSSNFLAEIERIPNVHYHGYVSETILQAFYNESEYFIFPSVYEGFGLPMLDALVKGLKVLALDTGINREVLGSHAMYFMKAEDLKKVTKENSGICVSDIEELKERHKWVNYSKQIIEWIE